MPSQADSTYRVFYPERDAGTLPDGVTILQQYPAFGIVSTTPEIAAELRKRYPVEELPPPKPLPSVTKMAGMAEAVAEKEERAPYIRVVRFKSPPGKGWEDEIKAIGCEILDPLGRLTVVVSCPNKTSLAKLHTLPNVARISEYVPDIQLSPASVGVREPRTSPSEDEMVLRSMPKQDVTDVPTEEPIPGAFIATFFTAQDAERAKRRLKRDGIRTITEAGETGLFINLLNSDDPERDLQTIATQLGLRSLRNQYLLRLHNDVARKIIAERVADTSPSSLGLTGKGEVVAVADSGLDNGKVLTDHPDFKGRVRHIQSFPSVLDAQLVTNPGQDDGAADELSGHGTHVAGSILGSGAAAQTLGFAPIQGTAPQAELVFQAIEQYATWTREVALEMGRADDYLPLLGLYGIPNDLKDLFKAAYTRGARIHSNSWGGGKAGDYNARCEQLDQFIWDHRDLLVLFSAGNEGADANPIGEGIDSGSVRAPGTAKNCLTVGASENNRTNIVSTYARGFPAEPFKSDKIADSVDDIAPFSNRGPCATGRRKPDVVAPGTAIFSARSLKLPLDNPSLARTVREFYDFKSGTSMATPLVAGCAALVRQHLREQLGMTTPTAALVKAALIHSAQYFQYRFARSDSKPWADNEQGWGRVSLRHLLNPDPPTKVVFIDHTDKVPANESREFTFQVADANAPLRVTMVYTDFPGKDLINNLNLIVYAPDGRYFIGNDFAGTGVLDTLNNVEGVVVPNPQVGTWRVQVIATDQLSAGPQDFALVLSGGGLQQT